MNEEDVYIDTNETVTGYLYESEPINDSLLPPVFYVKRGDKRVKLDANNSLSPAKKTSTTNLATQAPIAMQSVKAVKMENILMTRPLFDKPNTALIKLRRDIKMQRLKGWPNYKLDIIKSTLPIQPEYLLGKDDWMPNDDFIILHVDFILIFFAFCLLLTERISLLNK
jgi:hypothetical protein